MDPYSIWPVFALTAALLAIAASPVMAVVDPDRRQGSSRRETIDGLRGFLALAVFFHHAALYPGILRTHQWTAPPSRFYALLGPLGVAVFFMITGFLFWSRILRDNGQTAWLPLYIGRVLRIGPLYLLAIAGMLAAVFLMTGPNLNEPLPVLATKVAKWATLGWILGPDINGYPQTWSLLAGVTWSLHYEWLFYAALPVLAVVARLEDRLPPVVALVVACAAWTLWQPGGEAGYALLFAVGMLVATLDSTGRLREAKQWPYSLLLPPLLAAVFLSRDIFTLQPTLLLGAAFAIVVGGCNAFGLLTSRPALRLGEISYGIYLLQGLVLAAVFSPRVLGAAALSSPILYWAATLVAALALVAAATLAHILLERPGIALGRHIAHAVRIPSLNPLRQAPTPAISLQHPRP